MPLVGDLPFATLVGIALGVLTFQYYLNTRFEGKRVGRELPSTLILALLMGAGLIHRPFLPMALFWPTGDLASAESLVRIISATTVLIHIGFSILHYPIALWVVGRVWTGPFTGWMGLFVGVFFLFATATSALPTLAGAGSVLVLLVHALLDARARTRNQAGGDASKILAGLSGGLPDVAEGESKA